MPEPMRYQDSGGLAAQERQGPGKVMKLGRDLRCRNYRDVPPLSALKARTPGSAAVVEGHLVAVGVGERESAAERPVDGR